MDLGRPEKRLNIVVILLGCFFIGLYGCVKPPIKEMADAEAALAAARLAGAEIFRSEEYRGIEKKLAQARLGVEEKRYKAAKVLALESAEEAWQTKSRTEIVKEKTRQEAEKVMAAAHKALGGLEKSRAVSDDIGKEYKEMLNLFRVAQRDYEAEEYFEVIDKAGSIMQQGKALQKKVQQIESERKKAEQKRLEELRREEEAEKIAEQQRKKQQRLKNEEEIEMWDEHVVKAGDCLWKICQDAHVYNNPLAWMILYKANRSQIRDPDLIYPGQRFIIPRSLVQEEIYEATMKAKNRGEWSLFDNQ